MSDLKECQGDYCECLNKGLIDNLTGGGLMRHNKVSYGFEKDWFRYKVQLKAGPDAKRRVKARFKEYGREFGLVEV